MKTLVRCLVLFPLLALAACCANTQCNRDDLQADSLYLTLKSAPVGDKTIFTETELDTVYLQRYSIADSTVITDPQLLIRGQQRDASIIAKLKDAGLDANTLVISNITPFAPSTTGGKLSDYNYLLTVHDGAKGSMLYKFRITDIVLKGNYEADGCCTYYHNTKKTFNVNKVFEPATETDGKPIAVTLAKPG
ncbi:hypothetical protein QMK33_02530 [Hymenobacter sp. H14-R3]|uniref:hypothetical protein n=1 Tax=Hymenobacter sp. H14-R3 TaxID=3046308 RepID=UPI0024B98123|nr:hypothetical protein [Hymenobacter sp. H14-R3]MDJ0364014.1 hypothetical protein [Hymenobacter sp. H14-R3]